MLDKYMARGKVLLLIIGSILVITLLGLLVFGRLNRSLPEQETNTATNLGITYLPLTPKLGAYYRLEVTSGALVTAVASNSPADKAGIEVGDVILNFNRSPVSQETPLLEMMMTCNAGSNIVLEVWRANNIKTIELIHW